MRYRDLSGDELQLHEKNKSAVLKRGFSLVAAACVIAGGVTWFSRDYANVALTRTECANLVKSRAKTIHGPDASLTDRFAAACEKLISGETDRYNIGIPRHYNASVPQPDQR